MKRGLGGAARGLLGAATLALCCLITSMGHQAAAQTTAPAAGAPAGAARQTAIEAKSAIVLGAAGLPVVRGDESQLARVLANLLSNALKYNDADVARVEITAERATDGWTIAFRDNGVGFPEDQAERIFGMFTRGHSSREYEGTGIGLALCRKIMRRHGGRAWAESAPGRGSTFYLFFPA